MILSIFNMRYFMEEYGWCGASTVSEHPNLIGKKKIGTLSLLDVCYDVCIIYSIYFFIYAAIS